MLLWFFCRTKPACNYWNLENYLRSFIWVSVIILESVTPVVSTSDVICVSHSYYMAKLLKYFLTGIIHTASFLTHSRFPGMFKFQYLWKFQDWCHLIINEYSQSLVDYMKTAGRGTKEHKLCASSQPRIRRTQDGGA